MSAVNFSESCLLLIVGIIILLDLIIIGYMIFLTLQISSKEKFDILLQIIILYGINSLPILLSIHSCYYHFPTEQ